MYEGSPAYYEWTPTKDGSFITYWFCYAGSALPRKIAEVAGYLPGGRRSTRRGRGVNEEEFDFLAALASAHPDLYREATRAQRPGATRRGWTDPIEDAARFLNDVITDKAPALWDARDNPHHLCHQGDWEGVSLELDPTDSLGEAVSMVTFQHGKATPVRDVEWVDGRACVYSARGSHATLGSPPARWTGSGDTCTAGQTWKTWEKPGVLNAEEQAWYGFGGAWGAAGNCGDLTGPLGPSLWKRPTGALGSDT